MGEGARGRGEGLPYWGLNARNEKSDATDHLLADFRSDLASGNASGLRMATSFGTPKRRAALEEAYREGLLALFHKTLMGRWSVRRDFWNRSLLALFQVLLEHGEFAFGERIALSYEALGQQLRRPPRSVTWLLQTCLEVPELIRVARFERGQAGSDGQPSPGHAEFELGPVLSALGGKAPESPPLPPKRGRPLRGHEPNATAAMHARLPPEILESLRQFAAANNTSLGGAIVKLVEQLRSDAPPSRLAR